MKIKPENWFFCELCNTISYKFDCCNNIACSGGGCDKCHDLNKEIWRMIKDDEAPKKENVPFLSKELES